MKNPPGGPSALRDPITVVTNHGIIDEMALPAGFVPVHVSPEEQENNYIECHVPGSTIRLCYEETSSPLFPEDRLEMEKLFAEELPEQAPCRTLNLTGDPHAGPDDSAVYGALCQSFVFGGRLVRDGCCVDEERTVWELSRIGEGDNSRTILVARMQFRNPNGTLSRRQALMAMPAVPGEGGCGYIWVEGTVQEVNLYEAEFLYALGEGQFRQLQAWS
jgi:hypothetical protein